MLTALVLMAAACGRAPAAPAPFLRATETVIGRASWQGQVVLLTDAPALLTVDPSTADTARIPLVPPPGGEFSPWGLGESDGRLFTVSGFSTLLRLSPDGRVEEPVSLPRPITNLIDLADGMAAQPAESAGGALAVRLSDAGLVVPFSSPARQSFGLTSAEENLLHLLSCSPPPKVVCWLPNDNRLFVANASGIAEAARLSALQTATANAFIAQLDRPLIVDALALEHGGYAVLRETREGGRREVWLFDAGGNQTGAPAIDESLRLFVHADADAVVAVTRSGRITRIGIR